MCKELRHFWCDSVKYVLQFVLPAENVLITIPLRRIASNRL